MDNLTDIASEIFDDEVTGDELNMTSSDYVSNMTSASVCVMCRYYLNPWLKAIRVALGSVIVVANIVTFVCLLRARTIQMALRLFLLNVAIVDGLYGLGFLYHSAIVDFPQFIVMNVECRIRYGMLCLVSMVALFTLMAMCVERVIALKFALSYNRIISKNRIIGLLIIIWIVTFGIVSPTYILIDGSVGECNFIRFIRAASFVVFSVSYFILMTVAVFSQLVLLFIARAQIKKILPTIVGDERARAAFKLNVKATSATLALAVPFVVCASPKVFTYMYLAFKPDERLKVESLTLLAVTVYLNVSNSLVNPIVYCWRLPELRKQILFTLCPNRLAQSLTSDPSDKFGGSFQKPMKKDTISHKKSLGFSSGFVDSSSRSTDNANGTVAVRNGADMKVEKEVKNEKPENDLTNDGKNAQDNEKKNVDEADDKTIVQRVDSTDMTHSDESDEDIHTYAEYDCDETATSEDINGSIETLDEIDEYSEKEPNENVEENEDKGNEEEKEGKGVKEGNEQEENKENEGKVEKELKGKITCWEDGKSRNTALI